MARFDTSGLDDFIKGTEQLNLTDGESDEVLIAGAEQVKKAWQFAAALHNLKRTGDMIKSIGYSKKPKKVSGVKQVDIYPQGTDRKGVRNAEKAFILHYGADRIKATHFVDDADDLCEGEFSVRDAMNDKLNEIYERKG